MTYIITVKDDPLIRRDGGEWKRTSSDPELRKLYESLDVYERMTDNDDPWGTLVTFRDPPGVEVLYDADAGLLARRSDTPKKEDTQ